MSDQAHLSAVYMHEKASKLVPRCESLTQHLKTLARIKNTIVHRDEVNRRAKELIDECDMEMVVQRLKNAHGVTAETKLDLASVLPMFAHLAPSGSMALLRELLVECSSRRQQAQSKYNKQMRRWYENAMRSAGFIPRANNDSTPSSPGGTKAPSSHESSQPTTLVDHLLSSSHDTDSAQPLMGEIDAFNLALSHLESMMPTEDNEQQDSTDTTNRNSKGVRMPTLEEIQRRMEQQRLMKVRQRHMESEIRSFHELMDEMDEERRILAAKLQEMIRPRKHDTEHKKKKRPTPPTKDGPLAQSLRKQLDSLSEQLHDEEQRRASRLASLHRILADIEASETMARHLEEEYMRNEAELRRMCAMHGVDLDANMQIGTSNERGGVEDGTPANSTNESSVFTLGTGPSAIRVKFTEDGSGRLRAIHSFPHALSILGLSQSLASSSSSDSTPPHPSTSPSAALSLSLSLSLSPGEKLVWCAEQLRWIHSRLDSRFDSMHHSTDQMMRGMEESDQQWRQECNTLIERVHALQEGLQMYLAEFALFEESYHQQLHHLADATARFSLHSRLQDDTQRQTLVLFQQAGEMVK